MGGTKPQEQVLDLRSIFGLTARVTVPAAEAGGRYVEMDCTVEPGSGTDLHIHPEQEERYEVLEGALEVFLDGIPKPGALELFALDVHVQGVALADPERAADPHGDDDPAEVVHFALDARLHGGAPLRRRGEATSPVGGDQRRR
jgi:hypothetical protein